MIYVIYEVYFGFEYIFGGTLNHKKKFGLICVGLNSLRSKTLKNRMHACVATFCGSCRKASTIAVNRLARPVARCADCAKFRTAPKRPSSRTQLCDPFERLTARSTVYTNLCFYYFFILKYSSLCNFVIYSPVNRILKKLFSTIIYML